ncbi:hypothetical protein PV327_001934 [Microctonus hyperodae]|uniref:Protein cereblon n=2 Tax=Microctonus hyperodae TaxID=165561 RepID=A0AA39KNK3_MICHY|nr:hypothetical protein PV327_001934 [Microctonus hyperodae]
MDDMIEAANDDDVQDETGHQQEQEYHDEDNDPQSTDSTFDMTLATAHSYLGNDLEILRGRTLLDNGIYINLPLWLPEADWSKKIILFPGQTLPIMERDVFSIEMLRKCIAKDRTFGVASEIDINCIGTTAEIYEYLEIPNANEIRVKAKGRQRFKILKLRNASTRRVTADVQILPEIILPSPFFEHRLVSLDRLRVIPTNEVTAKQYRNLTKKESVLTPWPAWVHHQYNSRLLSLDIQKYLQFVQSKFIARGSNIPTDPIDLSFWVAQNVIIAPRDMMTLLKQDCAISRLQLQAKLLAKLTDKIFVCKTCRSQIAKQTDVFPMNQEGIQSAYVNPHGAIHETVTLSHAQCLNLVPGPPSTDYSWFPGYAWTIASCATCYTHMGWIFTATRSDLKPKSFWGLLRTALTWGDREKYYDEWDDSYDHSDPDSHHIPESETSSD